MTDTTKTSNIIYFSRLNLIIFLNPILSALVSYAIWHVYPPLVQVALIVAAFSLIWIVMTWVTYYFSSLTIQKKRVILRTGLLVRKTVDIPLTKIETIDIRQSIIGSLFQYGTLIITGTGGTRHYVNYINKPLTCRRYIEQLMNEH